MQGVMKGLGLAIPAFNMSLYLTNVTHFPDEILNKIKDVDEKEEKQMMYAVEKVKENEDLVVDQNLKLNIDSCFKQEENVITVKKRKKE